MDKATEVFSKHANIGRFVGDVFSSAKNTAGGAYKSTKDAIGKFIEGDFAKQLGIFGAGLIISQFVEELIDHLKELSIQAKSPKYYQTMLQNNPRLLDEDPQEVAALWRTLYQNAPNLAQDPIAAGAFITQSINKEVMREHGGPPIDAYKTLLDIESSKRKKKESVSGKFLDALGKQ